MQDSLVYAGLERVTLVSDAEAVSAWFESEIAALAGTLIGIYHVDDTGAAVTLVRSGVAAAVHSALRRREFAEFTPRDGSGCVRLDAGELGRRSRHR